MEQTDFLAQDVVLGLGKPLGTLNHVGACIVDGQHMVSPQSVQQFAVQKKRIELPWLPGNRQLIGV